MDILTLIVASTLFFEDFTNYGDKAPGVVSEGTEVGNCCIAGHSDLVVKTEKDVKLYLEDIALSPDGKSDVEFTYSSSSTNSAMTVVFTSGDGTVGALPMPSNANGRFIIKVDGCNAELFSLSNRVYCSAGRFNLPKGVEKVNFLAKANEDFKLSQITVRTPEPIPVYDAADQFATAALKPRGLGPSALTADGEPIDLLGKSVSFLPAPTNRLGSIDIVWDNGYKQSFPITIGDVIADSPIKSYSIPQLGLKPLEKWYGHDGTIDFGRLYQLCVRPSLRPYLTYNTLCDKGVDIVRDWEKLPPASKHLTTVSVRRDATGALQLWVDGSYAATLPVPNPRIFPKNAKLPESVASVSLILEKGTAYRFNPVVDDELELWASPKAKAFYDELPDSADVGIAHYALAGFSLGCDGYTQRGGGAGYPAEVRFRLPAAAYSRAHIRFVLDDAPDKVPFLVCRIGRYTGRWGVGNTVIYDTDVDFRKGIPDDVKAVGEVVRKGRKYPIYEMDVDLPIANCVDFIKGELIDLDFLGPKEVSLQQAENRQLPRTDVSSAFNLISVKLERLDIVPEFVQSSPGNVFTVDEPVKKTSVRLTASADGTKGEVRFGEWKTVPYSLEKAGDEKVIDFDFSGWDVGYYKLPVTIVDSKGFSLTHDAVVCVTPEAGRLATPKESPYCTWWFTGVHGSPGSWDIGGPIMKKAGIQRVDTRTAKLNQELLDKYSVTDKGNVSALGMGDFDQTTGKFKPTKVKDKDGNLVEIDGEERFVRRIREQMAPITNVTHVMIWHESAPHCGIPPEVLGLAGPTNDVKRETETAKYVNECGRIIRKHFPDLYIQIGNSGSSIGAVAVPVRGGANIDYYDRLGQESVTQTMPPEHVSEVALQGQLIGRATARKLAGKDIKTGGCFEFIYRCEEHLGRFAEDEMAELHARDILISLMNDYPLISPGLLFDCVNAYCYTTWGISGIVRRAPYVYPKKSYLAYAVLTKALDGVKFIRRLDTGSTTVYAAEFQRKDGQYATAFWCARGEAEITADRSGELWTMFGKRSKLGGWFSDAVFKCSTAPVYFLTSKPINNVKITSRAYPRDVEFMKGAKTACTFKAEDFTVEPDPSVESQHTNFLPYLKPGVFTVSNVVDETEGSCVEIALDKSKTLQPVTEFVSEYTTLTLKEPVLIPGELDLLGLRVKGDSNWGKLRFEIEDAKGEVFRNFSTGKWWGCDIQDWPGYLAVNFDGWGDIYQYTDENLAGLKISPGPRSEQWQSCGGDKKIDFPVKLRAIHVVVNRYKVDVLDFQPAEAKLRLKSCWAKEK